MYAEVIIDISHEKLDRVFTYRIPKEMEQTLQIGMQVLVPFGKGNRMQSGYVIGQKETTDYDPSKVKEISRIAADAVPIESQLIRLAAWMRSNFGATMNQALKTVIPVKKKEHLKQKRTVCLAIADPIEAKNQLVVLQKKHQNARARVLEALIAQNRIDYQILTGKLHVTAAVLRAMCEQGMIRIESQDELRNPIAHLTQKEYTIRLNEKQQQIVDAIDGDFQREKRDVYLIQGVTGSGKTEVYIELIARAVAAGKQAIVLIPEISLTFQTVMRFYQRFADRVSILHSRLSQGERYDQFLRAKNGELDVMIGPRSALFTPFSNLGYIIIDEEQEGSYKSETLPRYHARETAIERARLAGASVVLGSATPSVESSYYAQQGKFRRFYLDQRANERPLPECQIVDLREELKSGNKSMLSRRLQEAIADRLEKKQQILLFLNRRGMSGFVSCRSCGEVLKCPHCDVSLSLHKDGKLKCHYCGYETKAVTSCPNCGSRYIGGFQAGTQKVEELVSRQFPMAKILRMDYDTTRSKDSYEQILSAFANEEADILIGTQMIVKGHDFPGVTLVGILAADLSLGVSDYRASERTFQLLTQAAGRAGRGRLPGEVIIQTYQPQHFAIQTAGAQDYEAFYEQEIAYRKLMCYPPVWNLLLVAVTSPNEEEAVRAAAQIADWLREKRPGLRIIGPSEAVIAKVNDIFRQAIYLKAQDYQDLVEAKEALEAWQKVSPLPYRQVSIYYDFNPMSGL